MDDLSDEWWLEKPKSKKKRLKKTDTIDTVEYSPLHSKERQLCELSNALQTVEKDSDDLLILEDNFVQVDGDTEDFNSCLKQAVPNWEKWLARLSKPASPIVMVIALSAMRCIQLNREAAGFRNGCTTVKLFAKHIKVAEQRTFLESHVVPFAIGTPNRINKLLKLGVLNLKKCRLIVIDWYWKDKKMRAIADIPEVKDDLNTLLRDILLPQMQSSKLKLFLY
ncbi:protein CMSS1-like [Dysidea avara]|uniref:protein CMSS1-like n=1 Tax=Dysidea avara TaxID=196820 RepID=UPI00331C96A5